MTRCSASPSARNRGSAFCIRRSQTLWTRKTERRWAHNRSRARAAYPKFAFIGVRCLRDPCHRHPGPGFLRGALSRCGLRGAAQRAFIVAVNCGEAGGTCFCVSMQTGPKAETGFDLALTELARRRTAMNSWSRSAARPARRCSAQLPHRPACDATPCGRRSGRRAHGEPDGPQPGNRRHQGAAAGQPEPSALGRGRRALPDLRQLHHGLPDLLLHDGRGPQRSRRRNRRARAQVGFLLHDGFLLHPRRQRATKRRARATGNG